MPTRYPKTDFVKGVDLTLSGSLHMHYIGVSVAGSRKKQAGHGNRTDLPVASSLGDQLAGLAVSLLFFCLSFFFQTVLCLLFCVRLLFVLFFAHRILLV